MQNLVIKNVKTAEFQTVNLAEKFHPEQQPARCYEYQRCKITETGEGRLKTSFYTLMPGKSNYPYHQHIGTEEFFYIISGTGVFRSSNGDIVVTAGDAISVPANENGGHMLTNQSNEPLVYLDVDSVTEPDVIIYPDSGNVRVASKRMTKSFKIDSEVNYLDGE